MVREEPFNGRKSFTCEVCGMHYEERKQAKRCEAFCEENDACDPDIIADALENAEP